MGAKFPNNEKTLTTGLLGRAKIKLTKVRSVVGGEVAERAGIA